MACVLMRTIQIDKRLKCVLKSPEQRRDSFLHHNRYIGYSTQAYESSTNQNGYFIMCIREIHKLLCGVLL